MLTHTESSQGEGPTPTSFFFCFYVQSIHNGLILIPNNLRLNLLICGFHIVPLQAGVESSWDWQLAAWSICWQLPPGSRSVSLTGLHSVFPCAKGSLAFNILRSNQIIRVSYFTATVWVTNLSQRVKAYAAFFSSAINIYRITSPL